MYAPEKRVSRLRGGEVQAAGVWILGSSSRLPPFRVRRVPSGGVSVLEVRSRPPILQRRLPGRGAPAEPAGSGVAIPADTAWSTAPRSPSAGLSGAPAKESDASPLPEASRFCEGRLMRRSRAVGCSRGVAAWSGSRVGARSGLLGVRAGMRGGDSARFPASSTRAQDLERSWR